jgi:uncharacterized protein (TIGR00106 family)
MFVIPSFETLAINRPVLEEINVQEVVEVYSQAGYTGLMPKRGLKVIAEFSIHPIGSDISVSKYVIAAIKAISKTKGVRYQTNPMSTVLEADKLDTIFKAVSAAHEAVFEAGAKRVDFVLRVDDRRDKARVMEDKVSKVLSKS